MESRDFQDFLWRLAPAPKLSRKGPNVLFATLPDRKSRFFHAGGLTLDRLWPIHIQINWME
jgi:hypothetical protein